MQLLSTFACLIATVALAVKADYDEANLPTKSDPSHNQSGFNDCVKRYGSHNKHALCQNVYLNSVQDFCLFAPATMANIGDSEADVVSYCTRKGHGTRLIPKDTLKGAHFLKTPSYVQVTGTGDFTRINIQKGDEGGELGDMIGRKFSSISQLTRDYFIVVDAHGATGAGNPVGGIIFTNAFTGQYQQIHEWQNFMAYNEYCFRGCIGQYADKWCPHVYDLMGCYWNEPANYDPGVFEECTGTEGQWPGVYNGKVFWQGDPTTPGAQLAGISSDCKRYKTVLDTKYNSQAHTAHQARVSPGPDHQSLLGSLLE